MVAVRALHRSELLTGVKVRMGWPQRDRRLRVIPLIGYE